jgi:hypothetical protein
MLVFKAADTGTGEEKTEGKWFEREVWGQTLSFKIRPRTEEIVRSVRNRHKRKKNGQDVYDEMAILDDLYDYLLEDFKGLGEELPDGTIKPMDVDLEGKKKVLGMAVPSGDEAIFPWVVDRANEQAFTTAQEEQKNSSSSLQPSVARETVE